MYICFEGSTFRHVIGVFQVIFAYTCVIGGTYGISYLLSFDGFLLYAYSSFLGIIILLYQLRVMQKVNLELLDVMEERLEQKS